MRGKIIVFDGLDSSGKKTHAILLKDRLKKHGFSAEIFHFPQYEKFFGGLVGKYLKGDFGKKEELSKELIVLLYAIDRYDVKFEIEKLLEQGKVVIMDRYSQSNIAFHSSHFQENKKREFLQWIKLVESRLPIADLVFFLDMPRKAAEKLMLEKAKQGNRNYMGSAEKDQHEKDSVFLDSVRKTYFELAKSEKNWQIIKCAEKNNNEWRIKSIQEIHELIWKRLSKLLVLNYTLKEFAEAKK
jgi:dTMP kinase